MEQLDTGVVTGGVKFRESLFFSAWINTDGRMKFANRTKSRELRQCSAEDTKASNCFSNILSHLQNLHYDTHATFSTMTNCALYGVFYTFYYRNPYNWGQSTKGCGGLNGDNSYRMLSWYLPKCVAWEKKMKHVKSLFLKSIWSYPPKQKPWTTLCPSYHCNTPNKKVTLIKPNNLLVH